MKEKTYIEDVDRSIYDIRNDETGAYRLQEGLSALDAPVQTGVVSHLSPDEDTGLGTFFRRSGHGSYRHVCSAQYKDDGEVVGGAEGD